MSQADIQIYDANAVQTRILTQMEYTVSIAKKSFSNPAPKNEINEKSRKMF